MEEGCPFKRRQGTGRKGGCALVEGKSEIAALMRFIKKKNDTAKFHEDAMQ